jgi:hypothetical protein
VETINCKICSAQFKPSRHNATLCSEECRKENQRKKHKELYHKHIDHYRAKARKKASKRTKESRRHEVLKQKAKRKAARESNPLSQRVRKGINPEVLIMEAYGREGKRLARMDDIWVRHPLCIRLSANLLARRYHERMKNDPKYKIIKALRCRLWNFVKGRKFASMKATVGCTQDQLMDHLAGRFTEGMTRENYGEWEIDHIVPCTHFDLTVAAHQAQCFHYTNLQPMWKADNIRKSNNIRTPVQLRLVLPSFS